MKKQEDIPNAIFNRLKENEHGMKIACSRCKLSRIFVPWIDKKKWPWGSMTMVVQAVGHKFGWKTIDRFFVCPKCQTDTEKNTDYSKDWYEEYYRRWNESKIINE